MNGSERQFVTPALPGGQDYTYRFRAEYERDGDTLFESGLYLDMPPWGHQVFDVSRCT